IVNLLERNEEACYKLLKGMILQPEYLNLMIVHYDTLLAISSRFPLVVVLLKKISKFARFVDEH
ncbi:MAG: hypothetical protein ACK56F_21550, partial [bacterium]